MNSRNPIDRENPRAMCGNDRISGDESDASRGLPVNLEVPPGLQVVPMSKHHDHGPADFSLPTSLHHHLLSTPDDVRERLKLQSAEQFLLQMARLQRPPPPDLDIQTGSVVALKTIPKGTQYGPFVGKLLREPMDRRFAWEVSDAFRVFRIVYSIAHRARIKSNINASLR
uniref:Uncharacterized protein n=1 Tax=Anopheles maculatus TaxID=74869 RepID=A0A182T862_9DIPT